MGPTRVPGRDLAEDELADDRFRDGPDGLERGVRSGLDGGDQRSIGPSMTQKRVFPLGSRKKTRAPLPNSAMRSRPIGVRSMTRARSLSTRLSEGLPAATPSVSMNVSTSALAEAGALVGEPSG